MLRKTVFACAAAAALCATVPVCPAYAADWQKDATKYATNWDHEHGAAVASFVIDALSGNNNSNAAAAARLHHVASAWLGLVGAILAGAPGAAAGAWLGNQLPAAAGSTAGELACDNAFNSLFTSIDKANQQRLEHMSNADRDSWAAAANAVAGTAPRTWLKGECGHPFARLGHSSDAPGLVNASNWPACVTRNVSRRASICFDLMSKTNNPKAAKALLRDLARRMSRGSAAAWAAVDRGQIKVSPALLHAVQHRVTRTKQYRVTRPNEFHMKVNRYPHMRYRVTRPNEFHMKVNRHAQVFAARCTAGFTAHPGRINPMRHRGQRYTCTGPVIPGLVTRCSPGFKLERTQYFKPGFKTANSPVVKVAGGHMIYACVQPPAIPH